MGNNNNNDNNTNKNFNNYKNYNDNRLVLGCCKRLTDLLYLSVPSHHPNHLYLYLRLDEESDGRISYNPTQSKPFYYSHSTGILEEVTFTSPSSSASSSSSIVLNQKQQ